MAEEASGLRQGPEGAGLGGGPLESPLAFAVAEADRQIIAMVRDALRRGRVMLAYQPVMMAADPTRVAFQEALLRVMDPTGRILPARDFIASVEVTETGRLLDCAALELGMQSLRDDPGLRLAVNMSARSIGYPRWMETLRRGLASDRTVGERLILEITESSAMLVPELVTSFMDDLQRHGIAFALDDFGAGYTAFRYFRQFFFDIVKIDGQFVQGIDRDPDNQVLAQALISIARHFDMVTVAESVETAAEAEYLRSIGIDCLQGYFFAAPQLRPAWDRDTHPRRA